LPRRVRLSDEAIVTSYAGQKYLRYVEIPTVVFSGIVRLDLWDLVREEIRFETENRTC
jgi:hypothetical protein